MDNNLKNLLNMIKINDSFLTQETQEYFLQMQSMLDEIPSSLVPNLTCDMVLNISDLTDMNNKVDDEVIFESTKIQKGYYISNRSVVEI